MMRVQGGCECGGGFGGPVVRGLRDMGQLCAPAAMAGAQRFGVRGGKAGLEEAGASSPQPNTAVAQCVILESQHQHLPQAGMATDEGTPGTLPPTG